MLKSEILALCALPGPAGWEDAVRDYIKKEAEPCADRLLVTPNGALLVHKPGRARAAQRVMLSAPMDEPALLVRSFTDEGFARFELVGRLDRRLLPGKKVFLGPGQVPAVVGMKPIHLCTKQDEQSIPQRKSLYLDLGADKRAEAEALVKIGDYGLFDPEALPLGGGLLCAKALGGRAACAVLLSLLRTELPTDTWFAFTTQSELGSRGALGAAFRIRPELSLALDGAAAADFPPAEGTDRVCALGAGVVLPALDRRIVYDAALMDRLRALAVRRGIPWQSPTRSLPGSEAAAVQRTAEGCRAAALRIPIRYAGGPSCVADPADIEAARALALAFLEEMSDG